MPRALRLPRSRRRVAGWTKRGQPARRRMDRGDPYGLAMLRRGERVVRAGPMRLAALASLVVLAVSGCSAHDVSESVAESTEALAIGDGFASVCRATAAYAAWWLQ